MGLAALNIELEEAAVGARRFVVLEVVEVENPLAEEMATERRMALQRGLILKFYIVATVY